MIYDMRPIKVELTPSQAARVIGCTVQHVRLLIRRGMLKADRIPTTGNQHGYRYVISLKEAERYREERQFPRRKG